MGFVPPLPAIGSLSNFKEEEEGENRSAFKELWQLTADYGRNTVTRTVCVTVFRH